MSTIKIPISIIIDYLNKNIDISDLVVNQLMENNSIIRFISPLNHAKGKFPGTQTHQPSRISGLLLGGPFNTYIDLFHSLATT